MLTALTTKLPSSTAIGTGVLELCAEAEMRKR